MSAAWFWCAYTARGTLEYLPIMRSRFAAELSQYLDKMADVNSVVKQRWLKRAVYAQISDLWSPFTLTMDQMGPTLRYIGGVNAPPSVADHRTACVPARINGRLELISRKIVSCKPGTKVIAVSRFREKLLPRFREKCRTHGL